jgi:hypothetical protein
VQGPTLGDATDQGMGGGSPLSSVAGRVVRRSASLMQRGAAAASGGASSVTSARSTGRLSMNAE